MSFSTLSSFLGFSALQRAENSSIPRHRNHLLGHKLFQCSSASRKFLNEMWRMANPSDDDVSVLFSEPKIPQFAYGFTVEEVLESFSALQRAENSSIITRSTPVRPQAEVSVLFSEPKIPQSTCSIRISCPPRPFQCSSASRKFLNPDPRTCVHPYFRPR